MPLANDRPPRTAVDGRPTQERGGISESGPSGTEGYAREADALVRQYESLAFADVHRAFADLFPPPPARVLDIGAGTGRDAAGFAASGYRVAAVEPTAELRRRAIELHAASNIEWIDDALPELAIVSGRGERFALVMLTAVWMHLDEAQRRRAMPRVTALLAPGGVMVLSLRHGPVPTGRRMFDVTPAQTIALAEAAGLICTRQRQNADRLLNRPGVSWDRLAFERPAKR